MSAMVERGSEMEDKAFLGRGWAFPVQPDERGDISLAAYEEDIRQAILIILGTARGERVMRPDFGSGLQTLVFEPLNTTTMELVRYHVEEALVMWEPRIDLREVTVQADRSALGKLLINIGYQVRSTNTFYNLVYPFYLQEASQ